MELAWENDDGAVGRTASTSLSNPYMHRCVSLLSNFRQTHISRQAHMCLTPFRSCIYIYNILLIYIISHDLKRDAIIWTSWLTRQHIDLPTTMGLGRVGTSMVMRSNTVWPQTQLRNCITSLLVANGADHYFFMVVTSPKWKVAWRGWNHSFCVYTYTRRTV